MSKSIELSEVFLNDHLRKLRLASLAVYLHMVSKVNNQGLSKTSLESICDATGYSKTGVRKAINDLLSANLISIIKHPGPNGFDRNVYQLDPSVVGIKVS